MSEPRERTGSTIKAAVIGSGNIGTDRLVKTRRTSDAVEVIALAGIDPASDGLARARRLGVATTAAGIDGLLALDEFADVQLVVDATSAGAHHVHAPVLAELGRQVLDLTPAAIGPYVVPPVNGHEHVDVPNLNMVTCDGQPRSRSSPQSAPPAKCPTPRWCPLSRPGSPVPAPSDPVAGLRRRLLDVPPSRREGVGDLSNRHPRHPRRGGPPQDGRRPGGHDRGRRPRPRPAGRRLTADG